MNSWSRKFVHLTVTAVLCFGALIALLTAIAANFHLGNLPLLLLLSGANGAVLANYQRLSKLPPEGKDQNQADLSNPMATMQLYVSPIIGGAFALLLFAVFFSGLIQGDFFPVIDNTKCPYKDFQDLMTQTRPHSRADAMKGVVWCFLAGYSERFVPNILDRLAEQSKK